MTNTHQASIISTLRAAGCVFAEDEARLLAAGARDPDELNGMVRRRVEGTPLEVILGWADFDGLRVTVEPGVFVPRQRSRFLIEQAASLARSGAVVVDLCCGSGALGAALATRLDAVELYAVDIDPVAVRCARRNIAAADGAAYTGDLFAPLPDTLRGRVDILLVNAPYVPTGELGLLPPEAREQEPRDALDGGVDGTASQRRVVAAAPRWLAPGGRLLLETSSRQGRHIADAVAECGMSARLSRSTEPPQTVVTGTRPHPDPQADPERIGYARGG